MMDRSTLKSSGVYDQTYAILEQEPWLATRAIATKINRGTATIHSAMQSKGTTIRKVRVDIIKSYMKRARENA